MQRIFGNCPFSEERKQESQLNIKSKPKTRIIEKF